MELLIAAAITAGLAALMLALVSNVFTAWNRTQGALMTGEEARLALDRLEQDLQSAMNRGDGLVWLAATMQTDTGASGLWQGGAKQSSVMIDPTMAPSIAECRFGLAATWLRFISATPATAKNVAERGGPVAVSYQIIRLARRGESEAGAHYRFFRSEVAADVTFSGGYDLVSDAGLAPPYETELQTPSIGQVMAEDVIDFGIRCYRREKTTGALTLIYPTAANAGRTYAAGVPVATGSATDEFPQVIELILRVLTPEGARLIREFEAHPTPGIDWWAIALTNSRVFTRRVELRADPA